jgi:hypothetical protein
MSQDGIAVQTRVARFFIDTVYQNGEMISIDQKYTITLSS